MAKNIIEVKKLTKKYGHLTAVDTVSFNVRQGEIFGLLGENGAGKTTTLEIIEGLRKATSGEITVLEHNVKDGIHTVKEKIGVQLQSSAYFDFLTLSEILFLFGTFYSRKEDPSKLLDLVGLKNKAQSFVKNLSGGQRQRFSIIASLVNDPEIVFLDEPTTGLDPLARRQLWELISKIKNQGKTIVLTTHYLEEAEILCDRVAIMEKGKIIAMDETHRLVERTKYPFKIEFIAKNINKESLKQLKTFGDINKVIERSDDYEVKIRSRIDLNKALSLVLKIKPESFTVGRATLEDLFIELTGKTIKE